MALRTERRFTRDLIFEAVPYSVLSMFTELAIYTRQEIEKAVNLISRTNNQRNHGSAVSKQLIGEKSVIPLGVFQRLNQLLNSPHLHVFVFRCHTVEVLRITGI